MRLDKFLVTVGIGSRKMVKQLIKEKRIAVNGQIEKASDRHIDEKRDQITYDGHTLSYQAYQYVMLNKPKGVLSARVDNQQKTVLDLLDKHYHRVFPVGRLDKDTEGLLLLTNDGDLAHQLLSPKKHVDKVYAVTLETPIQPADISAFEQGILLEDGTKCLPAALLPTDNPYKVQVIIQEGKFHQVKRMFASRNNHVVELKRLKMGTLALDERLKSGEYRELTAEELEQLKG